MEKIISIKETNWDKDKWGDSKTGYEITTNKQTIRIGISDYQSCCEDWGYFTTNDELQDFLGAEIMGIKLTDTCLNTELIKDKFVYGFDEGEIQFVDIETTKGTLQLAVYNSHNGYYGHSIVIDSEQLK